MDEVQKIQINETAFLAQHNQTLTLEDNNYKVVPNLKISDTSTREYPMPGVVLSFYKSFDDYKSCPRFNVKAAGASVRIRWRARVK